MANRKKLVLGKIEGLKPVKPATVEKFRKKMTDEVVPKIVRAVEKRRLTAAESRGKHLKY